MSIQSAINQGVSVASLLYTQTASYASKKVEKEIQVKNTELERQIENKKSIAKAESKAMSKNLKKSVGTGTTVDAAKEELANLTKFGNELNQLRKEKAELTGSSKDIKEYVSKRRKFETNVREMSSFIQKTDDALKSLHSAQEQKRMKQTAKNPEFYIGGDKIPEGSPLYAKALEEYNKKEGK